jgi:hypothetical protein
MPTRRLFLIPILILALSLPACGSAPTPLSPTETPAPTSTPEPQGVTLTYEDAAQVELVTITGRTIYIDIANTAALTKKEPAADDILLTTHLHSDHYYKKFESNFPGQKITTAVGKIELPEVTITSIASAHNTNDPVKDEGATDYIFIIETGGLRIAHLGDIGQEALSADQLAAIGKVDLLITQLSNSFSSMNADNRKGFNLIAQINPRLIIPTHSDNDTIKIAVETWTGYGSKPRTVTIRPDALPEQTSILILGNMVMAYTNLYKLQEWK